jgi:hypothetical protein
MVVSKNDMNKFTMLNKMAYRLSKLKNMQSKTALCLWDKLTKLQQL